MLIFSFKKYTATYTLPQKITLEIHVLKVHERKRERRRERKRDKERKREKER